MLCEISPNFLVTWFAMAAMALVMMFVLSGTLFYYSYHKPTYNTWRHKSNPQYPTPQMVKSEIVQMLKGLMSAAFLPALSMWLSNNGYSKAYCGFDKHSASYHLFTFFVIWFGTDLWSFAYHRLGHTYNFFWEQHKHHHTFYNPSPFSVIADEYFDQIVRAAPLLVIPLVMDTNMDLMFFTFGAFFYGYGVYLHWGHELDCLSAHHPFINTSFQHYIHHAKSLNQKPYHTGFFFKIWDQMAGSIYPATGNPKVCGCAACCCLRGERSEDSFVKVVKPDYRVLLKPSFWMT